MLKCDIVIILVNYNGFEDTKACLKSIAADNSMETFTVIVDNSQPNDEELKHYMLNNELSATLLQTESNLGFSKANNLGIEWANDRIDYQYLLILNNDTEFLPGTLSKLVEPFNEDKEISATTCKISYYENPKQIWYGGGDIDYKKGWPVVADLNNTATEKGANRSRLVKYVSGCLILFSKKAIGDLKGFEPSFFMYVEDLELSVRMDKNDQKIWYTAEAEILHKVQGSFADQNAYRGLHHLNSNIGFHFYHKKLNQYRTFRKHLKGWPFIVFCFNYWIRFHLKFWKLFILSPKRMDVLKAKFNVLKTLFLQR